MYFFLSSTESIIHTGNANSPGFVFSSPATWHSFYLSCQDLIPPWNTPSSPFLPQYLALQPGLAHSFPLRCALNRASGGPQPYFLAYFIRGNTFLFSLPSHSNWQHSRKPKRTDYTSGGHPALNSWLFLLFAAVIG